MDFFPISRVTELTGIAPGTLRAWERRYGLPKPHRTASGHRLYNLQDVALLNEVQRLLEADYSVSRAMERVRVTLPATPGAMESVAATEQTQRWDRFSQELLAAVENFDTATLDATYSRGLSLFPADLFIQRVAEPVLEILGERWKTREAGIAEEHFFSAFMRNKLGTRFHHEGNRSNGIPVIAACLPGELHEMGLLLFGLGAGSRGYRVVYLGPDLPLAQLEPVVARTGALAVVLSGTHITLGDALQEQLARLSDELAVPVFVGGELSEHSGDTLNACGVEALGAAIVPGLERFETRLGPLLSHLRR